MLSVGANSELEIIGSVQAKYIMVEPNNIFSNIGGEVECVEGAAGAAPV